MASRPSDVEIEVTESVPVRAPAAVAVDLEILRTAGVTVALDDFGTGYSSLNALPQLPLQSRGQQGWPGRGSGRATGAL